LELIGDLAGDPSGVEVRRFSESVVATLARGAPDVAWMQHVAGLEPADAALIPAIAGWYDAAGIRPRFEIAPAADFAPLASALAACGARHTGFIDALWCRTERVDTSVAGPPIAVRIVDADSDMAARYAHVHLQGHDVPAEASALHWPAVAAWAAQPNWWCYLAEVDGEPVAAAALVIDGDIGYLANAATLPSARGRGCQRALIARRLQDAALHDCEVVLSLAEPGSSSHRNLQRAGLTPAYTKVMWTVEP
jgi:GNAT superfamily N-acetyltransferase